MRKTSKEWKKDYKRHKTNKEREPKGGGQIQKNNFLQFLQPNLKVFWTEWLKVFGA